MRLLLAAVVAALLGTGILATSPSIVQAGSRPRAVVIVGPTGSLTADFLASGRRIAAQAEAAGMEVRRVFHPAATWENVVAATQGAKLVVYVGHGNGWPSPHSPFQEDTKNGFGLNRYVGSSAYAVEYRGADHLRARVRLAPRAVVMIYRSCYAAGNGERWMGAERDRSVAVRRVDNFAAGFLDIGASAVFAFGTSQSLNLPALLMRSSLTMDRIFRTRGSSSSYMYDGFKGWADVIVPSARTPGARIHLDPHRFRGYQRALTGDLRMTAAQWRGDPPRDGKGKKHGKQRREKDRERPKLTDVRVVSDGALDPSAPVVPQFSPDGDHMGDRLRLGWTLSERASITAVIRGPDGKKARTLERRAPSGGATITWDGRYRSGKPVPDGLYRIEVVARDRAGNVSRTRTVEVKVATTLRSYKVSRRAISPWDEDRLARETRLRVTVTRRAEVKWRIESEDGKVVRSLRDDDPAKVGAMERTWDGRNDGGRFVSRGWYTAIVVAKTRDSVVRYQQPVFVGPFRVTASDERVRRGERVTVTYAASEPLRRPPAVRVKQPGVKAYEVVTRRVGAERYQVTFRTKDAGKAGRMELVVVGRDTRGGEERHTHTIRVR